MPRAALPLIALVAAGCGLLDTDASELSFKYHAHGGTYLDQTVEIVNDGLTPVAPTLQYTPLDAAGLELPDVKVTTVEGSDFGDQVVVPDVKGFDILRFSGGHYRDVRDVRVTVKKVHPVKFPHVNRLLDVAKLDATGRVVTEYEDPFSAVRVHNPNDKPVRLRIVMMAFEDPPRGYPQQVSDQHELGDLIELAPGETKTVEVGGSATATVDAYFSR